MSEYLIRQKAVEGAALRALEDGLLRSPLLGRSTLAGSFRDSDGFAITFSDPGRAELLNRFPPLEAALAALAAPDIFLPKAINAWYLNLLRLPAGKGVGRHTDGTLRPVVADDSVLPSCVSVLYLVTPPGSGALELYDGERLVQSIRPTPGAIVHFEGALEHAVLPSDAERVSLVLEQYALRPSALAKVPAFKLDSRAGFAAYLADHAGRPPRKMDLE